MNRAPIISLTTDFGVSGPYVGAMRGVLLSRCPSARLVDITHRIPPHDVLAGAFVLAAAAPWFPDGTIHLAVVDPGVGGVRRALVVQTHRQLYVGPDNGLFTAILDREPRAALYAIDRSRLGLMEAHPTFHGRDLFAPVAAELASGLEPSRVGERVSDPVRGWSAGPRACGPDGSLELRVLDVDRFGNVTTDLTREIL
ncbi:MAG: SAM-dependent chlorinase/fluorinase, partial [Acidobacteriota bacterium]|nr:SAM-dependent chlorinase/fluorinase [Acidobacteriota bacterium]